MKTISTFSAFFTFYLFFIAPLQIILPLIFWVAAFLFAIYLDVTRDFSIQYFLQSMAKKTDKKIIKKVR
jgi:hypothetical protein